MELRAILFDLDETLVDNSSTRIERYRRVFGHLAASVPGVTVADCLRRYARLHRGLPNPYDRLRQVLLELGHADTEIGRAAYELASDSRWMRLHHGVTELLDDLAGRYPLGLVTNGYSRHQRAKLATFGLDRFFGQAAVVSEEVGVWKPALEIFEIAAARVGAAPGEILFVGDDAAYDIAGARAAGMVTAWVTGPAGRGIESDADFRIEHVTEVSAVVLALEA